MANKEYIEKAATLDDDKYIIGVTALAPMVEISKNMEITGKDSKGEIYGKDNILSSDLMRGEVASIKVSQDDERGE